MEFKGWNRIKIKLEFLKIENNTRILRQYLITVIFNFHHSVQEDITKLILTRFSGMTRPVTNGSQLGRWKLQDIFFLSQQLIYLTSVQSLSSEKKKSASKIPRPESTKKKEKKDLVLPPRSQRVTNYEENIQRNSKNENGERSHNLQNSLKLVQHANYTRTWWSI